MYKAGFNKHSYQCIAILHIRVRPHYMSSKHSQPQGKANDPYCSVTLDSLPHNIEDVVHCPVFKHSKLYIIIKSPYYKKNKNIT